MRYQFVRSKKKIEIPVRFPQKKKKREREIPHSVMIQLKNGIDLKMCSSFFQTGSLFQIEELFGFRFQVDPTKRDLESGVTGQHGSMGVSGMSTVDVGQKTLQ